jgi:hypothetical protein
MDERDDATPVLERLIAERLSLVGVLAESLELSSAALARNDAEAIALGAAHQAELCRQWSSLESELCRAAGGVGKGNALTRLSDSLGAPSPLGDACENQGPAAGRINDRGVEELVLNEVPLGHSLNDSAVNDSAAIARSVRLQADWEKLALRIRYLMRVHSSLLRHSQRTLAIVERVVHGCDPTYCSPRLAKFPAEMRLGE